MATKLRLETKGSEATVRSASELREFFKACDLREKGREPDWQDHLRTIEASKAANK
jgi:hypothetical protein